MNPFNKIQDQNHALLLAECFAVVHSFDDVGEASDQLWAAIRLVNRQAMRLYGKAPNVGGYLDGRHLKGCLDNMATFDETQQEALEYLKEREGR